MQIKESDIEKIADLAHLEITPEEVAMFTPQMTEIVTYVEQLNVLDTRNVEPSLGGLTPEGKATDSTRADEVAPSLGQKLALEEAPDAAAGHFRVPKVL
ncbi:MAG TPA: Asp-tRNA(Asn)/Glu-tRNA(Gln) amidotransferase subunit GatC [Pyrinomonadaceae bacterium]|nr:Asp-tRNA(Asn)/Glu-tRNA(Gln) amidotransferase subunit GatC [Pyrinomonadaceae bacterium]